MLSAAGRRDLSRHLEPVRGQHDAPPPGGGRLGGAVNRGRVGFRGPTDRLLVQ